MLVMSRRQYDTHGFDRQRYQTSMQPLYLDEYARALPLTLSYADRPQMRSAPITAPVERHQLELDQDSQSSNSQSRRRIAVACARCRKRKIKCSGDPGNGSGCQNCRAAGSEACNFFRVGSFPAQAEQSRSFDGSGMALLANAASFQQQEYPTRNRFPSRLATGLPANYAPYHEYESSVENYELGLSSTLPIHESYGSVYQMHDSNSRAYLTQSSYNPPTYSESPAQEALAAAGYSHSQAAYVDATGSRPRIMSDGHGVFSVGSLQHSLPTPTPDRKLPIPAQNPRPYYADDMLRPRTSSGTTSQHYTMASAGYTRVPPTNWSTETLPNGLTDRSSVTAMRNELMAPPPSAASTSTASTTSEINNVNYAASVSSSEDSPAAEVESIEQNSPLASNPAPTHSSTATGPARPTYNTTAASSSKIILPRHSSSISLYTYSSEKRNSPSDLDGVLVNGDEYEPLKHSHPINTYMPIHYAPLQPAPTSATRYTLPHSSHPNLNTPSNSARSHPLQRRPSIPSVSNS